MDFEKNVQWTKYLTPTSYFGGRFFHAKIFLRQIFYAKKLVYVKITFLGHQKNFWRKTIFCRKKFLP